MKIVYGSTALALLFGLGMAGASLPANAASEIVVAQAGAGAGGGAAGGMGGAAGDESGAVHPMDVHPASPELAMRCDVEGTGFVTTDEARACYDEYFGAISGGADHVTLDQIRAGLPEAEDPEAVFAEADLDRDQVITREEWLAWRERGFAEAAPEGQMPVEDYAGWHLGGTTTR